jgi:hypothetical protein
MSRFSIDPPDDDAYDVRYDGTACEDCGRPSVAWLCETCSDQRDAWAAATEAKGMTSPHIPERTHAVVEVALVPIVEAAGIVAVALVPVQMGVNPRPSSDARFLKRMAKAILSADLTNVKDVA